MRSSDSTNRRALVVGIAALLLSSTAMPAEAAVNISLLTSKIANKVRTRVRLTGNAAGINFGTRTFGPIDVPRDGKEVKVVYNVLGVVITIVLVIIGIVLTVVTFGTGGPLGVEIFRKTVKKTVPA